MRFKPRRLEEPEINLISLIDVVLMMVVFFMLSSTFTEEGRLKVKLPAVDSVPVNKPITETLVVTVTAAGAYLVNNRELVNSSADTLRAAIVKETAGAAGGSGTSASASSASAGGDSAGGPGGARDGVVTVRADGRATHQAVVTAMDVLGKLGFRQLNIATTDTTGVAAP